MPVSVDGVEFQEYLTKGTITITIENWPRNLNTLERCSFEHLEGFDFQSDQAR